MLSGGSLDKSRTSSVHLKAVYISVNVLVSSCSAGPQDGTSGQYQCGVYRGLFDASLWLLYGSKMNYLGLKVLSICLYLGSSLC